MHLNTTFHFMTIFAAFCAHALGQDMVNLNTGSSIQGTVLSINQQTIKVNSPHSDQALQVKAEKLKNILFSKEHQSAPATHSEEIILQNGDRFPGTVFGLNKTHLSAQTWFAGELQIPRQHVKTIYYGMKPQLPIYQGPDDIKNWRHDSGWTANHDKQFNSNNKGSIGRSFKTPFNFIFQTQIHWKSSPNFCIHLCADKTHPAQLTHSYRALVNSQKIQIESVSTTTDSKKKFTLLGDVHIEKFGMPGQTISIEFRINRSRKLLYLYVDDELCGTFRDQGSPPTGSSLVFESRTSGNRAHQLSEINLYEWDTVTQHLHREQPTDHSVDTISVSDGDRYSGELLSMSTDEHGDLYLQVKSKPLNQSFQIPSSDCSVIHFAEMDEETPDHHMNLSLTTGGTMMLNDIQLGESLNATHPLLGSIVLNRSILREIKYHTPQDNE